MIFSSVDEAEMAYGQESSTSTPRSKFDCPRISIMRRNEEDRSGPGLIIDTTYGRILFNSILAKGMDFYNYTMKSSDLAAVISDCYQTLGSTCRRLRSWTI